MDKIIFSWNPEKPKNKLIKFINSISDKYIYNTNIRIEFYKDKILYDMKFEKNNLCELESEYDCLIIHNLLDNKSKLLNGIYDLNDVLGFNCFDDYSIYIRIGYNLFN